MAASVVRCWSEAHLWCGCAFSSAARRIRPLGVIIFDTGPLVDAALSTDSDDWAGVDLFTASHAAQRHTLVLAPVVAEVGYLAPRSTGSGVEALCLSIAA